MDLKLRQGVPGDAEACARICYDAFEAISGAHNFPSAFPTLDEPIRLMSTLLGHPGFYAVVAEADGVIVGSNFLDERSAVPGVGPVTVGPGVQNRGVGRVLMQDVMRRAAERGMPGVRLVQSVYHLRSLSLYAKLGFQVRDLLACMQGTPPRAAIDGYRVRHAVAADAPACDAVCRGVHGHDRAGEVADAIAAGTALVVEHGGWISGYATNLAFFGHAAGESNDDLKALISAADAFGGPGVLVPATNSEMLRWCLDHGLRMVQPMSLMSIGLYNAPQGAYLPSVLY